MKSFLSTALLAIATLVASCSLETNSAADQPNVFTGNEVSYTLYQGSEYNINGLVTFKETTDGFTQIELNITSTEKGLQHPVHIHFLSIEKDGDIAVVLNPVEGETGISTTLLKEFENGTTVKYADLIDMEASVKVHLGATQPDYGTILVGGNVGLAKTGENPFGRYEITVCK